MAEVQGEQDLKLNCRDFLNIAWLASLGGVLIQPPCQVNAWRPGIS